jgi:hypothetical protein
MRITVRRNKIKVVSLASRNTQDWARFKNVGVARTSNDAVSVYVADARDWRCIIRDAKIEANDLPRLARILWALHRDNLLTHA